MSTSSSSSSISLGDYSKYVLPRMKLVHHKFRDALFSDPNAVRRSQVGSNHEEFQDDHALMNVNTIRKN